MGAVAVPSVATITVDVPSLAVVIARVGTSTTLSLALVVMAPVTVAPT